eukprot:3757142-Lingulodinium_polyedra.AAC.1
MGFRGSAVLAHRVTEATAARAGLPAAARCVPGAPVPLGPPFWGVIMDDLWVVTVDDDSEETAAAKGWAPA